MQQEMSQVLNEVQVTVQGLAALTKAGLTGLHVRLDKLEETDSEAVAEGRTGDGKVP